MTYSRKVLREIIKGAEGEAFFQFAGVSGATGISETAMTGDYSAAAQEFYIQPPANETWRVQRVIILIRDGAMFAADNYGAGAVLTNGISIQLANDGGVLQDLTSGVPIMDNASWGAHCYDYTDHVFGAGDNFLAVRWTFEHSGRPVMLRGSLEQRLQVVLNDDFTGLIDHRMKFDGYQSRG